MNFKNRITEINERLGVIETELRNATEVATIETLSSESTKLIEERGRLTSQLAAEAQRALNVGTVTEEGRPSTPAPLMLSKRDALMLSLGKEARGKVLSDIEKRAVDKSLTTTATEYVEATEVVDGVNNGGLFIKTTTLLDLLREDEKLSPILRDTAFTEIKGLTEWIYRKSRTKAKVKTEGNETGDNQIEFATITGSKGFLQIVIPVTDELKALSDFDFGAYLYNQIADDLAEDWTADLIYADGTDNKIKGVVTGATSQTYATGKATEGLINGIKKLTGKYRRGAKAYVSQDIYDDIIFAIDSNGNFKYPLYNNTVGVNNLGPIKIEVDENLKTGEFIIGNISKYFKANILIPITIEEERHARRGVTDYIVKEFCATTPVPGAFIHGTKA